MNILTAVIFGLIQGFGEMLPISSSAHLVLFPYLFNLPDPGLAFDVALHVGSLVAIIGYFWREWIDLAKAAWKLIITRKVTEFNQKLVLLIILASIPGAIFGLLLDNYAESTFRNPILIASTLIIMGAVLYYADHHDKGKKEMKDISYKNSITIGLAQALAIIPGVSRSGVTITAGLFEGINKEDVARFSFLMSAPIIAGAALVKVKDLSHAMIVSADFWVALFTSVIASVVAISFLLKLVRKNHFDIFVFYRFFLAAIVIIVFFMRK
jgi:undecaprenyl-diphosphatase